MAEEEEKNAVVEEALQSPDKKIPLSLSLSLGPPNLSLAFDFPTPTNPNSTASPNLRSPSTASLRNHQSPRSDFDSGYLDRSDRSDDDDLDQTKKKQKTVWTPELHQKFVEAVAYLGVKNAMPKTITERMNVEGLTRESVACHLQKYRSSLKRPPNFAGNSTTDRQFATIPLPFGPAPPGYNVASSIPLMSQNVVRHQHQHQLQLQQLRQQYNHLRQIIGIDSLHPGFLDTAPLNVDEKSEEGCREIKELPLFPTGKD